MALSGSASDAAGGIAALAVLTIYGIQKVAKDYHKHQVKALTDDMKAVNKIYAETLCDMVVQGHSSVLKVSIPPIFIFDDAKPDEPPKSLSLNTEILKGLSDGYPTPEASLQLYGEHIHNAMLALREFDYARLKLRGPGHKGKEDDLTSSVLAYLILMLSTHCYKFEGPALTLCYLDGLKKFVYRFGSFGGKGEKSDHYEHMSEVYKELTIAWTLLFQYSLSLSYTTILNELIPELTGRTNELLKCAVKLITPVEHWEMIEFLTVEKILDGLIKRKFNYAHEGALVVLGAPGASPEIKIMDCPHKTVLQNCAKNYFTAIRMNDDPENKAAFISNKQLSLEFTRQEYLQIMEVCAKCKNFLTQKVKPQSKHTNVNIWLREYKNEINERLQAFIDILALANNMIVLMYFCGSLANRVKQLGEIYISNPHHCVYIFEIFNGMSTMIDTHTKELVIALGKIVIENGNLMPIVPQQAVYEKITEIMGYIRTETVPYMRQLYLKHTEHPKNKTIDYNKEINDNVNAMVTIAKKIADEYKIVTPITARLKHVSSPHTGNTPSTLRDNKSDPSPSNVEMMRMRSSASLANLNVNVPAEGPAEAIAASPVEEKVDNETSLKNIHAMIRQIRSVDSAQASEYSKIYHALSTLRLKAISLELETGLDRQDKGKKIEKLIADVCIPFENFLQQEHNERIVKATELSQKFDYYINSKNTLFLDKHYSTFHLGDTNSRHLAEKVNKACKHLAKVSKN
jgi:hypothetical protein